MVRRTNLTAEECEQMSFQMISSVDSRGFLKSVGSFFRSVATGAAQVVKTVVSKVGEFIQCTVSKRNQ